MGVHWYFRFAVKTADNRVKLLKYTQWLFCRQSSHELHWGDELHWLSSKALKQMYTGGHEDKRSSELFKSKWYKQQNHTN